MKKNTLSNTFISVVLLNLFISFFLINNKIIAQDVKQGSISGTLQEATNSEPVPYANISLVKSGTNEIILSAVSTEIGNFLLANVPNGKYDLKIQFIGFEDYIIKNIIIDENTKQKTLGQLLLKTSDTLETKVVEVTGQKEVQRAEIGSRVYNVGQDLVNKGGTAVDILQNIPSVQVDENNAVTMRGSGNLTVLINGKQSGITGASRQAVLDKIPASSIDRIEIITNPSAKYDADGGAGIINIILKQNQEDGMNGSVGANIGNNNRHNANLELSYKKNKINVFGNINFNQNGRINRISFLRNNYVPTLTIPNFQDQLRIAEGINNSFTGNLGLEYAINKKNTISFEANSSTTAKDRDENLRNNNEDINRNLNDYYIRNTLERGDELNSNYAFNYVRKLAKPRQELKFYASHARADEMERNNFDQTAYDKNGLQSLIPTFLQRNANNTLNQTSIFQLDYSQPIKKDFKIDFGAKSIIRQVNSDFSLEDFDRNTQNWVNNTQFSNKFDYLEQIHALYSQGGGKYKKWEFDLGVRLEQAYTTSKLVNTNETFTNNYFNIFPSAVVARKINDNQKLQVSYSRRINRPGFGQLNPFANISNPLVFRGGNPFLKPEFTDSYELGYIRDWEETSITTSVFYKKNTNVIQQILENTTLNGQPASIYRPNNINSSQNFGIEIIGSHKVKKWLSLNANFSYFRLIVDGTNFSPETSNNSYSWNTRLMMNFTLPQNWKIQTMVSYNGPTATAQGTSKDVFMSSIGISKQINKLTLNLRVVDIPQIQRRGGIVNTTQFTQDFGFRGNTRTIQIGANYRFGGNEKKRTKKREEGGFDAGGGEF